MDQPGDDGATVPDLTESPQLILAEAQVLESEKRTALSIIRLGVAIEAMPLSILGFLVATRRFYANTEVAHLLIPLLVAGAALAALGVYLIVRGITGLRRLERHLADLKKKLPAMVGLFD